MKRFLTATLLVLAMFVFAACGDNDSGPKKENSNDADAADTADDSDKTDSADDADTDTGKTSECTGLSVDWSTAEMYYGNYYASVKLGDESLDDQLILGIFQNNADGSSVATGEYDLGSEVNSNYETCTECVLVGEDYVQGASENENGHFTKNYFQKSGTLKIEAVDNDSNIKGTLAAVLIEVTIADDDTYRSTPVEGGACLEIETSPFDTGVCTPQCEEGWECGADGCGGSCGGGCDGKACSADHKCVDFACGQLATSDFGEFKLESIDYYGIYTFNFYRAYTTGKGIGSESVPDLLEISIDTEELVTKTVVLTDDIENSGDASVLLYEDYNEEAQSIGKTYFQESGTLEFTKVKEGTMESQGKGSFRVVEVDEDYIPLAGGKCYEFKDLAWDTICVPKCEGKVCGPDGCGGTCGDGCGEDKTCSTDQKSCVDFQCSEITLDTAKIEFDSDYISYKTSYTPNTGDPEIADIFSMQFFLMDEVTGTHNLYGTNYGDDSGLFIRVMEDTSSDEPKNYFQQKGTVTVTAFDKATGNLTADFKGIRLEQVTIDSNYISTPVPGGTCYEIKDTAFNFKAE